MVGEEGAILGEHREGRREGRGEHTSTLLCFLSYSGWMDQFPIFYHGSSTFVGEGQGPDIGISILSSFSYYGKHEDQKWRYICHAYICMWKAVKEGSVHVHS